MIVRKREREGPMVKEKTLSQEDREGDINNMTLTDR